MVFIKGGSITLKNCSSIHNRNTAFTFINSNSNLINSFTYVSNNFDLLEINTCYKIVHDFNWGYYTAGSSSPSTPPITNIYNCTNIVEVSNTQAVQTLSINNFDHWPQFPLTNSNQSFDKIGSIDNELPEDSNTQLKESRLNLNLRNQIFLSKGENNIFISNYNYIIIKKLNYQKLH